MAVVARANDAVGHFLGSAKTVDAGRLNARRENGKLPVGGIDALADGEVSEAASPQDRHDLRSGTAALDFPRKAGERKRSSARPPPR